MSSSPQPPRSAKLEEYVRVLGVSIGKVVQEVAGAPYTCHELDPAATQALLETLKENSVSVLFEASNHLAGNQGFLLSNKEVVHLAQLLLTEPEDGSSVVSDDHRDATGELFRQFAGSAASSLKELAGGEVSFKWVGLNTFPENLPLQVGMEWSSPGLTSVKIVAVIGSELIKALAPSAPHPLEFPPPSPAPVSPNSAPDPKLEMLMDVELDVTLRFGERNMVLREVLDLSAGSVVELDQNVQDPVELLVGKKVIARGEVVVVDGSYALRVTQIVSPLERIESLRG